MDPLLYVLEHTDPIVIVVSLFLVDRLRRLSNDLRQHMNDEKQWREQYDSWRIDHITNHGD
jgi:hypothetical protein